MPVGKGLHEGRLAEGTSVFLGSPSAHVPTTEQNVQEAQGTEVPVT